VSLQFKNPSNGYIEESTSPWLWCLLFGAFYFAVKGVWRHFFIAGVLAICTFGLSWLIYPFFADDIIRTAYLRRGWTEVFQPSTPNVSQKTSPATVSKPPDDMLGVLLKAVLWGVGGLVLLGILIGIFSPNEHGTATPSKSSHAPEKPAMIPAKYDEAEAVIKLCGKPTQDHPQDFGLGAGSEGRALVYHKYNTELWFYRGHDSPQWILMNAFVANGNDVLSVEAANKRMPCMNGGLQAHFGHLAKEAADIKHQVGLDNPVKARKDFAKELDAQLLDIGIESKTFTVGQDATVLVIEDALAGRVRANQIAGNSTLMAKLKILGFKKLKYNNGFEDEMFTGFYWDLTKN
jgi:hypothetical protein